jgi:hypothetical protein
MKNVVPKMRLPGWSSIPLPDQVKRLLIIFLIIVSSYYLARQTFVPETFGEQGHFRAASIDSIMALPISYTGEAMCAECHDDVAEVKMTTYHRDVSCEVCHGPGVSHAEADDPSEYLPAKPSERGFCLLCHEYDASKPTGFPQIDPATHNPADLCMDCHDPHDPVPPDVPEECSACHGEIARTKAVSPHMGLACIQCHETPEEHKVTPRAIIPGKPQNRAFCGQCHATGADSPANIPRVEMSTHETGYNCWQCHYPHHPEIEQ